MFAGDEVMLDIPIPGARSGLARLALAGLLSASQDAHSHGSAGPERAGAGGPPAPTRVQTRPLARGRGRTGLAIRWEAAGPGREQFSVLDADLGLVPAGADGTLLTLSGTYRPPPGEALDQAVVHQVAASTIRNFLSRVAAGLAGQPGPAAAALAEFAPRRTRPFPDRP